MTDPNSGSTPALFCGYERLRPLFFGVPPETAHHLALKSLQLLGMGSPGLTMLRKMMKPQEPKPRTVMGIEFPNVVGLAAGYDKNAVALPGLVAMGFGHIEVGTVTPLPQPGNPKPRVFRIPERSALVNHMGFPSSGADVVAQRLAGFRGQSSAVIGVNLGKNKETPAEEAVRDYLVAFDKLAELSDYVAINVSSPNTPGLRRLQGYGFLVEILKRLVVARNALPRRIPLAVKLSSDLSEAGLDDALAAATDAGIDGVIAVNTTRDHEGDQGGLSGAPLKRRGLEVVRHITSQSSLSVIACGGIMSAGDAQEYLDLGAELVQLWTGLIYRGPKLIQDIAGLG